MNPIAARRCISGRDLSEPRLSPDGRWTAFATSGRTGAVLCVVPTQGGPERLLVTHPTPRVGRGTGGGGYAWLPDSTGVVFAASDGHLWQQTMGAADPRRITPDTDTAVERSLAAPVISDSGSFVVVVIDESEVWEVSLVDGAMSRVDDGAAEFCADPCISPDDGTITWVEWSPPDMPWDHSTIATRVRGVGAIERHRVPGSVQQPGFLPDGTTICVRDDTGWLNVWVGDAPLVEEPFEHAGPSWGPNQRSYATSPDGSLVAFTRNEAGFGRLCVAVRATGAVTEIGRGVHGQLHWSGDTLTALRSGGRTPTQVVAYDMADLSLTSKRRRVLAVGPALGWDDEQALVEPELVEAVAADDGTLFARIYEAPGADGRLICWVHGGPTDQWQVTFMPRIAYWVSRGFSVLVPDHRGSTGHGREYQQALSGRWGELDVSDTAALLAAAHDDGHGVPERTAVMGSSAGGMTALLVAAHLPHLVACASVAYPVCDIGALDDTTHRFEAHYNDTLVGPRSDVLAAVARRDRSPVGHVAALASRPLLVMHGDADPVVPVDQSRGLVERVRAAGGSVEYVEYPGEGHGFRQPVNQLDEYERVTAFVSAHIPPR